MAEEDTDYSKLPLEDRLTHKVWKARLEAYQDITSQFQKSPNEQDDCFRPFLANPELFKKIVMDSNVVAQESGIAALAAFLEYGGAPAGLRLRNHVVTGLCEKGLSSMRAGTKQKTIECLMLFIELDTPEPIIDQMIPSLSAKLPKLVAGTVKALAEIYAAFGAKTVSPKLVLPSLPKLFSHADRNVRSETSNLTVELYKWMGAALEQVLFADLKPVQQKDLASAFEKVKDEKPTQQRLLKSQREAMEANANTGSTDGGNADGDVVMGGDNEQTSLDPYDMVDPVNVLSKLPSDLSTRVTDTKWKERVEVLTETQKEMNVMKYADDDYQDLVRILARCQKDANIQVVSLAANCIELMAKGLRRKFHHYYPIVLNPLLERCKEKKPSVLDALNGALDAVFQSTSLSDILNETLDAMKHKTPQVRLASCQYLIRCLKETTVAPNKSEIESIITTSIKLVGDTLPDVRTSGFEAVGTLMKITGERELNAYLDSVDDIKLKKIKEFYEKAEVKSKLSASKPRPTSTSTSTSGSSMSKSVSKTSSSIKRKSVIPKTNRLTSSIPSSNISTTSSTQLKKKVLPSSTIPSKRGPTSPLKNDPNSSRIGQSRGLTGRSLQSTSSLGHVTNGGSKDVNNGLNEQEKQELEELRKAKLEWAQEKEKLNWQVQESFAESSRLMKEIQNLTGKIEKFNEQHTNDVMTIKSKDTQLQRYQSDLEISRLKISQLENEIELIQKQKSSSTFSSYEHLSSNDKNYPLQESNSIRGTTTTSTSSATTQKSGISSPLEGLNQRVGDLSIDAEQKENNGLNSAFLDTNDESWKRAAEVTSQLKARIEKMKARSRNSGYRNNV